MARDQKKLDKEEDDKDREQGVRINKLKKEVAKEEDAKGISTAFGRYRDLDNVESTTPLLSYLLASPRQRMEMAAKRAAEDREEYKKGGSVKSKSKSKSASSRGDGIAQRGKTRGGMC